MFIAGMMGVPDFVVLFLSQPLPQLLLAQSSFYWLYLASAAVLAICVCWHRADPGPGRLLRAMDHVFDARIFWHRSARADYATILINNVVALGALAIGIASSASLAQKFSDCLTAGFGTSPGWHTSLAANALFTLIIAMSLDFANFAFHWLQHRSPYLWELHKVHHSAEVLTPLTALRVHPITALLGAQFIALVMALPSGAFLYLFEGSAEPLDVLGINAVMFVYHTFLGSHLAHSHVWMMLPRGVREIVCSPALHLIHHSSNPRHVGRNLGFTFTIWDRLAGTFYQPQDAERHGLVLGLAPADMADLQTPWQLCWTPLRKIARRLGLRKGTAQTLADGVRTSQS